MPATQFQLLQPVIWALLVLPVILVLERWIARHLHIIGLMLTGKYQWAVMMYALIMFPGVFLHELSHWVTANLLGVRTVKFSVWPQINRDGTVTLGYVAMDTRGVGFLRESMIGAAPLFFGSAAVWLIGYYIFDSPTLLSILSAATPEAVSLAIGQVLSTNDSWIWLYLLFAISNAMMPSRSDTRGWPAFFTVVILSILILYFAGFETAIWRGLTGPIANVFGFLALAWSITVVVDLLFIAFIVMVEWIMRTLTGSRLRFFR